MGLLEIGAGEPDMILSLRHRFIYIANTRCASNTFERTFFHAADLAMIRTWHGKRCDLFTRYESFFRHVPASRFVILWVVRNPVDWVVSWFNFRCDARFASPSHPRHANYCGHIDFAEFLKEMARPEPRSFARLLPQHTTFDSCRGHSPSTFVVPLPLLREASERLAEKGHLPHPLPPRKLNAARSVRIRSGDVTPPQAAFIEQTFARDLQLYRESWSCMEGLRALPANEPPSVAVYLSELARLYAIHPQDMLETAWTRLTMPVKKALHRSVYAYR